MEKTADRFKFVRLREVMATVLPTDSDFEAFCIDHYIHIQKRFSNGMDRIQKQNILIEHVHENPEELLHLLKIRQPPNSAIDTLQASFTDFDSNFAYHCAQVLSAHITSKDEIFRLIMLYSWPIHLLKELTLTQYALKNWQKVFFLFLRGAKSPVPLLREVTKRYNQNGLIQELYSTALRIEDGRENEKSRKTLQNDRGCESKNFNVDRFLHTAIAADGILNISLSRNFYGDPDIDPNDPRIKPNLTEIFCFLVLPQTNYLIGNDIKKFTTVSAVCLTDPKRFSSQLKKYLTEEYITILKTDPTSNINRFDHKEHIAENLRVCLFDRCLTISVALPARLLTASRTAPKLSYQSIVSVFLLPLLQAHADIEFARVKIILSHVGDCDEKVRALLKKAARATFGNDSFGVCFPEDIKDSWALSALDAVRFVNWSVNALYHEIPDTRWIDLLSPERNKAPHPR